MNKPENLKPRLLLNLELGFLYLENLERRHLGQAPHKWYMCPWRGNPAFSHASGPMTRGRTQHRPSREILALFWEVVKYIAPNCETYTSKTCKNVWLSRPWGWWWGAEVVYPLTPGVLSRDSGFKVLVSDLYAAQVDFRCFKMLLA